VAAIRAGEAAVSLTVAQYAEAKGLPVKFLESIGVREANGKNGHPHLVIPYYNADGTLFRNRLRLALAVPKGTEDKRFIWDKAERAAAKSCLYGLNRLGDARKAGRIVIVEGESDCHTLWYCGVPAIGVPGATGWKKDYAEFFDGVGTVYVISEKDKASGSLVDKLKASTSLNPRLRVVTLDGAKDPSEFYLQCDSPDAFRLAFEEALEERPAIGHPKLDEAARIANDEGRSADGEDLGEDIEDATDAEKGTSKTVSRPSKKTKAKSQASLLADLAMKQCDFFRDEFGTAYASLDVPHDGGQHRETHKIKAKSFGLWLRRTYYHSYAAAPSTDAVRTAMAQLEAHATIDGPKCDVFMRVATHDGAIYIDICNDRWQAYEVDATGWRIRDDPPVYFVRSSSMLPLAVAKKGDAKRGLAKLKELTRIRDSDDFVVVVGFLLAALAGRAPFTVIIFLGEPGAAKTTHLKTLRMLVDPNRAPVRSPPDTKRDVYVCATKSAMAVFNNLSRLPEWLSDTLCVVTEDDESLIFARVPVMMAAVENVVARGDLADRTLYVTLDAVPEKDRVPEDEFLMKVEKDAPTILGALLTGLSVGLKRFPALKVGHLPRMAAFAKWGAACEEAFWDNGTFLAAYAANAAGASEDVLETDYAVVVFRSFMKDRVEWNGTMTQLLDALADIVKAPMRKAEARYKKAKGRPSYRGYTSEEEIDAAVVLKEEREKVRETLGKGWPSRPHFLSARLKKVGPQLRRAGILIEWPRAHLSARRRRDLFQATGVRFNGDIIY
jgi:hypothetical protein